MIQVERETHGVDDWLGGCGRGRDGMLSIGKEKV